MEKIVENFGSEIKVLVDIPNEELVEFNEIVGKKIAAFRNGFVLYAPGGGGQYGKPVICDTEKEFAEKKKEMEKELRTELSMKGQKTLGDF